MQWLMQVFHRAAMFLGRGKSWMIGTVRVYLWPFVAMGIWVALLLAYDYWYA